MPIATSTRPVRATLPERAKTFVPLLVCGADGAEPLGRRWRPTVGRLASVSTLLMIVGLPNRPLTAGNGGRGRGMPRLPSMLWIKAVSSPQTNAPAPILMMMSQIEIACPGCCRPAGRWSFGLGDGRLQPLDGQRIFGADVDVGLRRADAVGGDGHAFEQAVRIAFDHGPIHERAGIAFVGVADQIFLVAGFDWRANFHFLPVGKPPPPRPRSRSARPCRRPRRASSPSSTLASAA